MEDERVDLIEGPNGLIGKVWRNSRLANAPRYYFTLERDDAEIYESNRLWKVQQSATNAVTQKLNTWED